MDETPLRDQLAIDRTNLANERTLLAYVRAFIGLFLAGVTFVKLFADDPVYVGIGFGSMVSGVVLLVVGGLRYARLRRRYSSLDAAPPRVAPGRER